MRGSPSYQDETPLSVAVSTRNLRMVKLLCGSNPAADVRDSLTRLIGERPGWGQEAAHVRYPVLLRAFVLAPRETSIRACSFAFSRLLQFDSFKKINFFLLFQLGCSGSSHVA